jgi:hypothetical protein
LLPEIMLQYEDTVMQSASCNKISVVRKTGYHRRTAL